MKTKQTIWFTMVVILPVLSLASGVQADLINPGFETDAVLDAEPNSIVTGWDNFNGAATASANLDPTRTGIGSLILPGNGGFGVPGASQIFPASPGQIWDFQGYGLTPTELPEDITFGLLKIVWKDAANEELQVGTVNIGTGVGPDNPGIESTPLINSSSQINTWIFSQAQGVAPENTAFVEFLAIMVDQSAGTVYFDDLQATVVPEPPMGGIYIDIKPQSCPNPLNVKSKGVLPVAVLGTEDFDVSEIDVSSILLEGVSPLRSSLEDVAAPIDEDSDCACATDGPDGYMDLTLKFDRQELLAALGEVEDNQEWLLYLTASLYDGTEVEGSDCILIIQKGR